PLFGALRHRPRAAGDLRALSVRPRDAHLCGCGARVPLTRRLCPSCRSPLVRDARGALSLWTLGALRPGITRSMETALSRALSLPVVVQPAGVDERPSARPARDGWRGRSANVFLSQIDRRARRGAVASLGLTEFNLTPRRDWNFVFGLAYLSRPACVVSLHALDADRPTRRRLVSRAVKIALHELGHTFGLDHHGYDDGVDCLMIGDAAVDSVETVDARGRSFCDDCATVVARRAR
ncbi:MAG: archaemetzincin, partial [Polyangiales bacterium]